VNDSKHRFGDAKQKLVASGQQFQTDRDLFLRFVGLIVAKTQDIPTLQIEPPKEGEVEISYIGKRYSLRHRFDRTGDRFESRVELSSREDAMGDGSPLHRHIILTRGGVVRYADGRDSGLSLGEEHAEDVFFFLLAGIKAD
jgi:hypothetical protein